MQSVQSGRLALRRGVELDFIAGGDPQGAPLIMLHGLSDSCRSMQPLMSALPREIRSMALSLRGHGDSSRPQRGYAPADMAADVADAMDRLGVRDAMILGHSMGSVVAQELAVRYPLRAAGLILVGAFAGLRGEAELEAFCEAEIFPLTDPIDPLFVRGFQESTLARTVAPGFIDLVVGESLKVPAHVWKSAIRGLLAARPAAGITAPTLLLWGDQDGFALERQQAALIRAIPGAVLETFEGTGHSPHWEEPERAARVIADFVLRHVARAAA